MNTREEVIQAAMGWNLTPDEVDRIIDILGRLPNAVELAMFGVMWSEHCCYKNSLHWLKQLPKEGKHVLKGAGEENAGLIDLGDGLACAFKIESHNHPSAIAPYHGAATGVGGIHRDIFTTGARPIAALDSLHFGHPEDRRSRWIMDGVVRGIGDYGNSFGVPTIAGEVYFDDTYKVNPIVNAMSVGVAEKNKIISAVAREAGWKVFIAGAPTGRDGIKGAAFASVDLDLEEAEENLPAVQIGDPFMEKILLEAILEANEKNLIAAMQDMGAAGLLCSTSEMAARGKKGMIIHLEKVPLRHPSMKAWEILLSESQERMLILAKPEKVSELKKVFDKWDVPLTEIGEVIDEPILQYYFKGEKVAELPSYALAAGEGAPVYKRTWREADYRFEVLKFNSAQVPVPDWNEIFEIAKELVTNPTIASKKPIIRQYDHMVQIGNKNAWDAFDAAIMRVPYSNDKFIAVTTDCNPYYVYADPYVGTQIAVAEACRNIVCSGGEPVGVTNCLNFGNPYDPRVYWQFVRAVQGMRDICRQWELPITGGNVSFYNQSEEGPIMPTPVIGIVGIVHEPAKVVSIPFKKAGDIIVQIGPMIDDIASSQYLIFHYGIRHSPVPVFDIQVEKKVQDFIGMLIKKQLVKSIHDLAEGGLWIALIESAIYGNKGFDIQIPENGRRDGFLFGEAQSRVIVTVSQDDLQQLISLARDYQVPAYELGTVTDKEIRINGYQWRDVSYWKELYESALEKYFD